MGQLMFLSSCFQSLRVYSGYKNHQFVGALSVIRALRTLEPLLARNVVLCGSREASHVHLTAASDDHSGETSFPQFQHFWFFKNCSSLSFSRFRFSDVRQRLSARRQSG